MSTQPNVKSFSITDAQGDPLRLSVSTDIVDYMDSARTFGREDLADPGAHGRFQRRLIAIPDPAAGVVTPMVLSIGSNNGLYLVRKAGGTAGDGWQRIDLGPALAGAGRAAGAASSRTRIVKSSPTRLSALRQQIRESGVVWRAVISRDSRDSCRRHSE